MMIKIILYLIPLLLVVADWEVAGLSVSDLILLILIFIILIQLSKENNLKLNKRAFYFVLFIIGILIFLIPIWYFSNEDFVISKALIAIIKISLYMFFFLLLFRLFDKKKHYYINLYNNLLFVTSIICIIGIYIFIAIKQGLPYEFFWEFTRKDENSFLYYSLEGTTVRIRSIFSEPAHLGLYLNFVLALGLYTELRKNLNLVYLSLFSITLLLTGSFSSILVFAIIFAVWMFLNIVKGKNYILLLIIISGLMVLFIQFKENIEKLIIIRAEMIVEGADQSASIRLVETWGQVQMERILFGNGLSQTPNISNVYAYVLSDLGVLFLLVAIVFTIKVFKKNIFLGIFIILYNFSKGGYLHISYWIIIVLIFIFVNKYDSEKEM